MPTKIEPKSVDFEANLSAAQRMFQKLAPQCSVAKRAAGVPQVAPQQKQMGILKHELEETVLCINLARKGQHAVRDTRVKRGIKKAILNLERLKEKLRDERWQLDELDCLNYAAKKNIIDLLKTVPSPADELSMLENAYNRLRRMENRLDLATKRLCIVNTDNKRVREEINRLLIERHNFNIQWKRTISKLLKGKMYLMDIFEIATDNFADRDEWSRKLDTLKWKGLYQLNKDILEMQIFDSELNYLAKLEEFLRVKGSRRVCEADEIAEMKRQEENVKCQEEIAKHDELLEEIFNFTGTDRVSDIIKQFKADESLNLSLYVLLCEVLQQSNVLKTDLEVVRQKIIDQLDVNEYRYEREDKRLLNLRTELHEQRLRCRYIRELNHHAEATLQKILTGIQELVKLGECNITPLTSLLGNHKVVTKWNVNKFLGLLELEIKSLIQTVYGTVKPPVAKDPMVKVLRKPRKAPGAAEQTDKKVVADPRVSILRPKRIEDLVPYQPCAYCVEDYIMNLVFETPAVPIDKQYILDNIFHLQEVNTDFGIYTLTVPEKRHAYRDTHKDNVI